MNETNVVRVDVDPVVGDFYDLRKGSRLRHLDWILVLIGLLYAYFVFAEIVNEGFGRATEPIVAMYSSVSLLAFFGVFLVRRIWVRLMFRHGPSLQQRRQYLVSGAEVQMHSEAMTCMFRLNAFSRIVETRHSFLFFLSPIFGPVVPKRCLSSASDIVQLRDLYARISKAS